MRIREVAIAKAYERKAAKEKERIEIEKQKAEVLAEVEVNGGAANAAADDDSEDDFVCTTRRKTSVIHKAFDKNGCCKLPPGIKGICNSNGRCGCKPKKTGGGTTNFWSHLLVHHPDVYLVLKGEADGLTEVGQTQLNNLIHGLNKDNAVVTKLSGPARKVLDDNLADAILEERLSFSIGTRPSFKKLFASATNNAWDGCSEKYVESRRLIQGTNGREAVRKFHRTVQAQGIKVANSSDIWSQNGCALLGQVSHAILEFVQSGGLLDLNGKLTWVMFEFLAGATPCGDVRHTGDWIKKHAAVSLSAVDCNPTEDVFLRLRDGGSNMRKAYNEDPDMWCCDHLIEIITAVFMKVDLIAEACLHMDAVTCYMSQSTISINDLLRCFGQTGCPQVKPTEVGKTRWRGRNDSFKFYATHKDGFVLYDARHGGTAGASYQKWRLNMFHFTVAYQGHLILAPFAEVSIILEAKVYPTSNLVLMCMWGLLVDCQPTTAVIDILADKKEGDEMYELEIDHEDLLPCIREGREALHTKLKEVWRETLSPELRRVLLIAMMCDPRLKHCTWQGCRSEDYFDAKAYFTTEFELHWAPKAPQTTTLIDLTNPKPSTKKHMSLLDRLAGGVATEKEGESENKKSELEEYMALKPVPMEVKLLEWWPANKERFPNIAKMAQQYLSIPATSASAERLFSLAGANFSDHRQRMTDDHLCDLLFAKINVFMNRRFSEIFKGDAAAAPLLTNEESSQNTVSESSESLN